MTRRGWGAAVALALLVGLVPTTSAVSRARTCEWGVMPTPAGAGSARGADLGPQGRILAVGERLTDRGVVAGSMRWDGSAWIRVPVPPAAGADVYLADLAFMGGEEAIAVGTRTAETELPYSLSWDGIAWTELPIPAIAGSGSLTSVTHVPGTSRAWAVGWRDGPNAPFNPQPLIMRWQEGSWRVSLSRLPLRDEALLGVASAGAETWAVGATRYGSPDERTLVLRHRPGEGWQVVPSPQPGRFQELAAVSARSRTDVIAVGRRSAGGPHTRGMLIRWDGKRWRTLDADRAPAVTRAGPATRRRPWPRRHRLGGRGTAPCDRSRPRLRLEPTPRPFARSSGLDLADVREPPPCEPRACLRRRGPDHVDRRRRGQAARPADPQALREARRGA